jgi:predicted dehydrogenase
MKITRRSFLKTGLSLPFVMHIASCTTNLVSNDRLRVGVIGMGKQGRYLLNQFLSWGQVMAVCDVDTTRREDAHRIVDEYYKTNPDQGPASCAAYNDYEELLAREDIDAVCITTPDHWHTMIVLDALRAGKDVYCEKPLTHDIAEAVAVIKEVAATRRILQTGSMQRSMMEFRVACELARNDVIGPIEKIECGFGDPAIPCDLPGEAMEPGLDWNRWLGPAPERPYNSELSPRGVHKHFPNWRRYREYGGGGVADWGAHHLDIAQWALGMDESGPVKILPPEDRNAKTGTRLIYGNGVEVIHKNEPESAEKGVVIFGEKGRIIVNRGRFQFDLNGKTITRFFSREDGGSLESKVLAVERDYLKDAKVKLYKVTTGHVGDFVTCVNTRKKPITHEGVGAHSAICCHLTNLAYFYGEEMHWDPVNFTFTDGTGKTEWLSRKPRDYKKKA